MPRPLNLNVEAAANGYITPREEHFVSGACLRESALHERRVLNSNHDQAPNPASLAKMLSNAQKQRGHSAKVGLRDRICCHQWNWFTMVGHPSSNIIVLVSRSMYANSLADYGKLENKVANTYLFSYHL